MKKALLLGTALLLVILLCAGAAWAKPDKAQGQGVGLQVQQVMGEFNDIDGHWAMGTIVRLHAKGLLQGFGDGTFKPEDWLTYAQAFVLKDRIADEADNEDEDDDANIEDEDEDEDDADIEDEDEGKGKGKGKGMKNQDADDNDDADIEDEDEDDDADIEDEDNGKGIKNQNAGEDLGQVPEWARESVQKAAYRGYINRFHSEQQCTRLAFCVALALELGGGIENIESVVEDTYFEDGLPVYQPFVDMLDYTGLDPGIFTLDSEQMYKCILYLYAKGIIVGDPAKHFNPNQAIKRCEAAIIMEKVINSKNQNQ